MRVRAVPTRRVAAASRWGRAVRSNAFAYALLAPALILIVGLLIYPLLNGLWLAFTDQDLTSQRQRFIGLANFAKLLRDRDFAVAVRNTVEWVVLGVLGQVLVGLGLALYLNLMRRGRSVAVALLMVPWAVPTLIASTVWGWIFNQTYGYINSYLKLWGLIDSPIPFLGDRLLALPSVVAVLVWRGYPFVMIVLLAALQTIDAELYEAARIDGAGRWNRFRYVTLPGLMPAIVVTVLLETIWVFNYFDLIYQLTRGGPGNITMVLSVLSYVRAFEGFELGYGAAVASVMFVVLMVFSAIYLRRYGTMSEGTR